MTVAIDFDNSYVRLPAHFYAARPPVPVATPKLVVLNTLLAELLGLDPAQLAGTEGLQMLAGNLVPDGASPIATAYAGHQFGNFVPQLGDGRAVLLGEVVGRDGVRRDIQLKGAGPTPFSRGGDGRAGLGPVLREYLLSEAMAAMRVPTTRALAAVTTGEQVFRQTALPGAILTRVATSHIRIGTFQYFAARGDDAAVHALADHVIARHYPEAAADAQPYRALLAAVAGRQARLVAQWLLIGFIHGVMNTDNCSIAGETIDYGPCAFLDAYDPAAVFSSIDRAGRYAYGNQPQIAQWNLSRLAETLLPLLGETRDAGIAAAQDALGPFAAAFEAAYSDGLCRKIGLAAGVPDHVAHAQALLRLMAEAGADFTQTFRRLSDAAEQPGSDAMLGPAFESWLVGWRHLLAGRPDAAADMRAVNPAYIPRNHMVEAALEAAQSGDFAPFERLREVLAVPYDSNPGFERYAAAPAPGQLVYQTFCGT